MSGHARCRPNSCKYKLFVQQLVYGPSALVLMMICTLLQDIANDGLYHPTSDSRLRMNLVQGNNYGTPADYPTPAQQAQGLVCGSVINTFECIKTISKASLARHMNFALLL